MCKFACYCECIEGGRFEDSQYTSTSVARPTLPKLFAILSGQEIEEVGILASSRLH